MDFSMILSSGLVCTFITIGFAFISERYNDICRIKSLVWEMKEELRLHRRLKNALSEKNRNVDTVFSGKLLMSLFQPGIRFKFSGEDKISFYRRLSQGDFDKVVKHFLRINDFCNMAESIKSTTYDFDIAAMQFIEVHGDKKTIGHIFEFLDEAENVINHYEEKSVWSLFIYIKT